MHELTRDESQKIRGGKTYQIICWGFSRTNQERGCSWDIQSGLKWVCEFWHGVHITDTKHKYAKFNW